MTVPTTNPSAAMSAFASPSVWQRYSPTVCRSASRSASASGLGVGVGAVGVGVGAGVGLGDGVGLGVGVASGPVDSR